MISIVWIPRKLVYVVHGGSDGPKEFPSFEQATQFFKQIVDAEQTERIAKSKLREAATEAQADSFEQLNDDDGHKGG
ncbi:MAG: hypothetical protein Q8M11_21235 [Sulfuritalea sp.]|nr:hypothetical protein [Sulfuritalea sp.]MDP1984649.1 hypothetical protein [Sulfuritalea sp.]